MQKGKTGLIINFYAVLAFILALIGQTLLCGILLLFVIMVEQNEWLNRQVIQAFILSFIISIVSTILNAVNIVSFIPIIGTAVSGVFSFITSIISIIILFFTIIGIVKAKNGKEAGIPLASKFAHWATGMIETKYYTNVATPGNDPQDGNSAGPQM